MTPGPTTIKKCTTCSKPIAQYSVGSGNTFGATFWTDGKRDAPMLPDWLLLIICPHCGSRLWIDDLPLLGMVEYGRADSLEFKDALAGGLATQDDYFEELAAGTAGYDRERYMRLRAWWTGNDKRRINSSPTPMSSRETANLTAFAMLLNEAEANDLVMKAEAMRELGRFDDALALLAKSLEDEVKQAVAAIGELAKKRDPYVRQMHLR